MQKKGYFIINNLIPTQLINITKYALKICKKNNKICKRGNLLINSFALLPQQNQQITKV